MDTLLHEITALPKVLGCFVYSGKKGVTSSSMPPIFTKNTINVMGTLLARSKQIGTKAKLNVDSIDIRYNEIIIIAKPFDENTVLATICEPGVNRPLLDMSINMVINDVRESLSSDQPTAATPPSKTGTQEEDAVLKPILAKMHEELADAIGPIATPVIDDCLDKWATQGPKSQKRLPDLAWMICNEIDDKTLESTFMEKIKKFL